MLLDIDSSLRGGSSKTQQLEERGKSTALQPTDKLSILINEQGEPARGHCPFARHSRELFMENFPAGLALFCAVGLAGKYCVLQNTSEVQVILKY